VSKTKKIIIALCLLCIALIGTFLGLLSKDLKKLPSTVITTSNITLNTITKQSAFSPLLTVTLNQPCSTPCYGSSFNIATAEVKLFGLFPVKKVKVNEVVEDKIWASGKTIGIALQSKGVVVVGKSPILDSKETPPDLTNFEVGDIIMQIEGEEITSSQCVENVINKAEYQGKELVVRAKRNNKPFFTTIKPAYDAQTKRYKLGLWVRDDASGIGTLTFVRPDNLRFGALGHSISDLDTGTIIDVNNGKLYKCQVLSIEKGAKGKAGELRGLFIQNESGEANVDSNTPYGIYGSVYEDSPLMNDLTLVQVGGRMTAKPGKAHILCCLDGKTVEKFNIEIIKTNYQSKSNDKSLVLKVTDKNLLKRTGGIVQGMSGSPIIQDGKLIGAVTHVFVNDPTKGFGIYLDWMINN